ILICSHLYPYIYSTLFFFFFFSLYRPPFFFFFFFFNCTATTDIYTLSLHDALPIHDLPQVVHVAAPVVLRDVSDDQHALRHLGRSEEHTSELQSLAYLVCRLLLEKKKKKKKIKLILQIIECTILLIRIISNKLSTAH